jgi:hypothetical protein
MRGPARAQVLATVTTVAVILVIGTAGCAASHQGQGPHNTTTPTQPSIAATPPPTATETLGSIRTSPSASPGPAVLETRAQDGSSALTIVYDPVHAMVWYVTDDAAGDPVLRGVATASGIVHDTRLPADDSGYIGEFSPLKVDPTGAVWLANNDRLLRYDPASGKLAGIVLSSKVAGALPGATSGSMQGTWPSGLGFLNGLTLLARANVPWLTEYDAALHDVGRIPVPTAYAGAKDLLATGSGTLVLLPWQDKCVNGGSPLLLIDGTGRALGKVSIGGDRLFGFGTETLASGGPGGANLVSGTTVTSVLPSTGVEYCALHEDLATPDPRGGVTLFLRGGSPDGLSVLEHVVDQRVVSAVTFPPVDISNAPKPPGASPLTTTSFWIDALATDAAGVSWMGVGDSLESTYLP